MTEEEEYLKVFILFSRWTKADSDCVEVNRRLFRQVSEPAQKVLSLLGFAGVLLMTFLKCLPLQI